MISSAPGRDDAFDGDRPLDRITLSGTAASDTPLIGWARAAGIRKFDGRLELLEVPVAEPQAGQVVIRIVGAGAGLWDVEEAAGKVEVPLPKALGWQGSGIVEQCGPDVEGLQPGDAVLAYLPMGGFYAERVTVPAAMVVHAPRSVPLPDAGALLISAATAYQALIDIADLQPGQTALVTAAAGGTGAHAVDLAKHLGAHVIAVAGPDNQEFLAELGADERFDYHQSDVVAAIKDRHPGGVDVLLDNVSAENFARYASLVRPGGYALGTHEPQPVAPDGVVGQLVASWERPASFAHVVHLVDDGVLRVRVRSRFGLDEAERAHELLKTARGRGSVLIVP